MDNQNKIKYKEAANSWFIKIFLDDEGNEIGRTPSFTDSKGSGTGLFREMQAWIDAGNEVEPQFTVEELVAKEETEALASIETTKSLCIQYLNESEIHVSNDPPYPGDVQEWVDARIVWRDILRSGAVQPVQEKPF